MSFDAALNNDAKQQEVRIVSLLPSITEVLSSLGVAHQIVGITHECDYPPEAIDGAQVVTTSDITPYTMTQEQIHEAVCGSLKNGQSLYGVRKQVLQELRPDIIFTQSLCDVCAVSYPVVLATCANLVGGPPPLGEGDLVAGAGDNLLYPKVISMEPTNLNDVLKTFHVAAKALGLNDTAESVTANIEEGLATIRHAVKDLPRPKVAFMEWHTPIFCGGHWIADMLEIAGGDYTMCQSGDRSAAVEDDDFIRLDPDVILIGPCGFSLDRSMKDTLAMYEKKPWWRTMRAVREGRVFALDGNSYYARPGPRLLQGTGIMAACMHGEQIAKSLGENLAPSGGYCCITLDMYQPPPAIAVLSAKPPIPSTFLSPLSFFVAWNGVLVLAYDGFSPPLVEAKKRLSSLLPNLKDENFGSKWPKTTLAAERDGLADPMSSSDLQLLKSLCMQFSEAMASEEKKTDIDISSISIVKYNCRSLEKLCWRQDVALGDTRNGGPSSIEEQNHVLSILSEWSDLDAYLVKVRAPGSRIGSYREKSSGSTCVTFLELPESVAKMLSNFRNAVNGAFPERYEWIDDKSFHCTLQSLD